jgi:hypothetical protein
MPRRQHRASTNKRLVGFLRDHKVLMNIRINKLLLLGILLAIIQSVQLAAAQAPQLPAPQPPKILLDTTYHRPGGREVKIHAGDDLQAAIDKARAGDILVLDAGATFTGNFWLPPKSGDDWIYIETSGIDSVAQPGQRISPAAASRMAKIQTSNSDSPVSAQPGAAHYRLVGLEITPATGAPRVYSLIGIDSSTSRVEAKLRALATSVAPALTPADQFPKDITIDRCYLHGSDTQDARRAVAGNGIAIAVIDSYISDIHDSTMDSQGIIVYRAPGPIKIVNNFISATTENILFGGAGGPANPYVPSDIEIRSNWLYKPLSWIPVTTGGKGKWAVKNHLEFKNAQRAIVSGNIMENDWQSAQTGTSVLLTPRVGQDQGGPVTVVDDINIENNVIKNVNSGFAVTEFDENVKDGTWHGETKRIRIANNLVLLRDESEPAGYRPTGFALGPTLQDVVFQHNTVQMTRKSACWVSFWFNTDQAWKWPPPRSYTENVWILDNVLCRQPSGDWGGQGTDGLTNYMGSPRPLAPRFSGNVMLLGSSDAPQSFPPKNDVTSKVSYVDPGAGNFQLVSPKWLQTTDGKIAGIDYASLAEATKSDAAGKIVSHANSMPNLPAPSFGQPLADRQCDPCTPSGLLNGSDRQTASSK